MDDPDMAFDGQQCAPGASNPDYSTMDYDFGSLNTMLSNDPSLTQGLATLGNCNSDDSCLDQRCLSHLTNSDVGYGSPFQPQYENGNSISAMHTPNLHPANFDNMNLQNMAFSQPSPLTQGFGSGNNMHQNNHHSNFWMTPACTSHHVSNPVSNQVSTCFNEWGIFLPQQGHNTSCFSLTPFGVPLENHHLQSNYGDCFAADCSSQCHVPCASIPCASIPCASNCGDDTTVCCFDNSCAQDSQSACCYGDLCDSSEICVSEPCMDEECQAALNPCADVNCTGTGTVSTTPISASVRTPSNEPDHLIQTITSPSDLTANTDALFKMPSSGAFKHKPCPKTSDCRTIHVPIKLRSVSVASTSFTEPSQEPQVMGPDNLFTCRWVLSNGVICGELLENNEQLQNHCKNAHLVDLAKTEEGYCCGWHACSRKTTFTQKSKLERHMQTHTGFKPVKCQICGIMLSAKQSLDQHLRIHSGEKPWKCKYPGCTLAFKQQSALTMHARTHTGEKPLQCEICGKKFGESSNLSKHRRTHNQKGTFLCKVCGRDFHRQDQLRRHMNTNHRGVLVQTADQARAASKSYSTPLSAEG